MKYIKYLIFALALFIPIAVFATPTSVDRITNRIEPLIKTDFIRGSYFTASSTTATSSFPNASTTNITILGKLFDRLLSAGTNGYVLQTNGTGVTWVSTSSLGIVSGGGSGTVTSVDMSVPTGLSITGNPITTSGTLALTLTSGYNIPLTASTTEWATAYGSTTALTPAYIRGLFSGTSPITFNSSTGAIGFDYSVAGTFTGKQTFTNASTTNLTISNILYMPGVSDGCATFSSGIATSTGTACGAGGSGGSNWTVGSNFLRVATTSNYAQAAYWVADSATGTSTFAGKLAIGTTTLPSSYALNVNGTSRFAANASYRVDLGNTSTAAVFNSILNTTTIGDFAYAIGTTYSSGMDAYLSTATHAGDFTGPVKITGLPTYDMLNIASSTGSSVLAVSQLSRVGIGTSSPSHLFTVAGDINLTGALRFNGLPGTSGQIPVSTGSTAVWTNNYKNIKTIVQASSTNPTTTFSATTTIELGSFAKSGGTVDNISCYLDAGTGTIAIGDNTNWSNTSSLTTSASDTTISSNNTFTSLEKTYYQLLGATTATRLWCTARYY